jgi:hypothetical protein
MDLSPLTPFYYLPSMRLYPAAEVLISIQPKDQLMKLHLTSGFFQIKIAPQHQPYYGVLHKDQRYILTRLPMRHHLAPSILQRLSQVVAAVFSRQYGVAMVPTWTTGSSMAKTCWRPTSCLHWPRWISPSVFVNPC